jgi:hypothetical protein
LTPTLKKDQKRQRLAEKQLAEIILKSFLPIPLPDIPLPLLPCSSSIRALAVSKSDFELAKALNSKRL